MTDQSSDTRDDDADTGSTEFDRCLSFTVSGAWGHFRRIEGNIVKQTYRIIPRTTVAGLMAAILGLERDSYYTLFGPDSSLIAIEPVEPLRTMNMPMNTLSTAGENITKVPKRGRKLRIGLPDPTAPRQQHNYEVLVDPAYRIDLWLEDDTTYERLREYLEAGKSHYVPSLGLSEYLASIDYHGEFSVDTVSTDQVHVDSVVPEATEQIIPESGVSHRVERSPAFMEADDGGRRTTGFSSVAYRQDAGPLLATGLTAHSVDDRTVLFV